MNNLPLVSIVIPTYNYSRFIGEAIESVLNSDFPQDEIEIIVVDDGSSDNTAEIVKFYSEKVNYIFQSNAGKAQATQVGINLCRGKYIFNLDADDFFLPSKLQEVVQVFEDNPDVVHVGHPAICWNVNEDTKSTESIPISILDQKISGRKLLTYFYARRILFGGGSTFAARASILKDFSIPQAVDMYIDEYLVLSALNRGCSFLIKEPLSIWRVHGKNFSGNNSLDINLKQKEIRSFNSMKAVHDEITKSDFDPIIKTLYSLKIKTSEIASKEQLANKSLMDVLALWIYLSKSFGILKQNIFQVIKAYNIFNRSLPTALYRSLKAIKR